MQNLLMNDVGHALNVYIDEGGMNNSVLMIDMGVKNDKLRNFYEALQKNIYRTDSFLLSHLHSDHYNGIFAYGNRNYISPYYHLENIYMPRIPDIKGCTSGELEQFVIGFISYTIFSKEPKLLSILEKLLIYNANDILIQFLSKGDMFIHNNRRYEVLWPPKQMSGNIKKKIQKANKLFEEAKSKYPLLANVETCVSSLLKELLSDYKMFNKQQKRESRECNTITIKCNKSYDLDKGLFEKLSFMIDVKKGDIPKKLDDSYRVAANELSLAFRQEDNILFLGDLEDKELKSVCDDLKQDNKTQYDIIIAPHHGTHWVNEMANLRCALCLASVGNQLSKKVEIMNLKSISKHFIRTDCWGKIETSSYNSLI